MPELNCVFFTGTKPCGKSKSCNQECSSYRPRGSQILLIHLGALGAVVRSTALLQPILQKYPNSQITWVTQSPAHHLLKKHPSLYRVLSLSEADLLHISTLEFDVAFVVDKSPEAMGVLKRTYARKVYGFISNAQGVVIPATGSAEELWHIGLSDELKFKINKKTEIQLTQEALELSPKAGDYELPLFDSEKDVQYERYDKWSQARQKIIVGLNTGCAATISAKKLSIQSHRELIRKLSKNPLYQIVLLGGPEDTERNKQIAEGFRNVIQSPTTLGLRDGLISVAACDVVITGDSLGMHMAISQKKYVIAWFGPTCAHEIELYGRGVKIQSQVNCGPCWKRSCHKPAMCYDLVNLDEITYAVERYVLSFQHEISIESRDSNSLPRRFTSGSSPSALDAENTPHNSSGIDLS